MSVRILLDNCPELLTVSDDVASVDDDFVDDVSVVPVVCVVVSDFVVDVFVLLVVGVVVFDFIVAPIFTGIGSAVFHISYVPWDPLTLKSAGLIHATFGAILGLYTFGRTREKLNK